MLAFEVGRGRESAEMNLLTTCPTAKRIEPFCAAEIDVCESADRNVAARYTVSVKYLCGLLFHRNIRSNNLSPLTSRPAPLRFSPLLTQDILSKK